ncbi:MULTISPECIES: thioredoxin domain-containing protein [Vibrio]|uniref:thioredoxin domain-containing protein n=1 Tax=Vibrio TaxID=662 RepID=UPI00078E648E|nr:MULTISPECIES: thioredoxin domain-containing protein [Vibrio]BAU70810.1 hypothetical protein [Vibrio sp. 04Ya108]BBM67621.1 hypothetical protein VA249_42670 [Vibrio alfacsensis]BCN27104.1 hypothetical protein VYA_42960 [Vibrio alfacsensis]
MKLLKSFFTSISVAAMLLLSATSAFSSESEFHAGMDSDGRLRNNVYETIEPEVTEKYLNIDAKEKKTVRIFFDFRCPFCNATHEFIESWASTLPTEYHVEFQHVITSDQTSLILASAYHYAKNNMTPPNFYKFQKNMYEHIHKTRTMANVGRLVREAMSASGVDLQDFFEYLDNDEKIVELLEHDRERQNEYQVSRTPSVSVGAKYLTHLDFAAGDPDKFINLLNIVVNMSIYEFE